MNIFQTHTEFSGRFDQDFTGGSLLSLFTLAWNIRMKLDRQSTCWTTRALFFQSLKQRFLLTPLVTVFVQGLTNNLLYRLISRYSETCKQFFQLLLDSIPRDKEGYKTHGKIQILNNGAD